MHAHRIKKYRRDESEVSCCLKYLIFGFNVIFWLLGLFILGVGVWAWSEKETLYNLSRLARVALDPAFILVVVGSFTFIIGFTGCVGALRENTCLLAVYAIFLAAILLVEISAGILGFIFKDWIKGETTSGFQSFIVSYREDPDQQNLIDWIQERWLHCCGIEDPRDWDKNVYFNCNSSAREACGVPFSCCKKQIVHSLLIRNTQCGYDVRKPDYSLDAANVIHQTGCLTAVEVWLEKNLLYVAAAVVTLAFCQISLLACFIESLSVIYSALQNSDMNDRIPCILAYDFSNLSISAKESNDFYTASDVLINNDQTDEQICCAENHTEGRFDILVAKEWELATRKKLFRYTLSEIPSKVLPGAYGFIAQFNPERASNRRQPQEINNVNQPFDDSLFNFNKVKSDEIMLQVEPWWDPVNKLVYKEESRAATEADLNQETERNRVLDNDGHSRLVSDFSDHKIIINASPLEYGNVLIVPYRSRNLPQAVTIQGLRMAVELLLLSQSRDFRVGFNSLCAFASVNHLHFHGYYLKHRLYIEHAKLKHLAGPCYEMMDYSASGFVFLLKELKDETQFTDFINSVFKAVKWMQENNVPYNIYITRGSSKNNPNQFDAVRIFLWGRTPSFGHKACDAFNPALCELAGHFPLKTQDGYENINENFVAAELKGITLETFQRIRDPIVALYN